MWRAILSTVLTATAVGVADADDGPSGPVSFREHVAPVLVRKCLGCHNDAKASAGLKMTTFSLLKKGGKSAGDSILVPGDPDASELVASVRADASPRMPYKLPPLSGAEIGLLERWVREGARFDGGSETETTLASLYDPLRGLPKIAVKGKVSDPVTAAAFAPDGATLAAAAGGVVTLYDVATGKPRSSLSGHTGLINAVMYSSDGARLIAAGGRAGMFGTATLWSVPDATRLREFRGHSDTVLAAEISPDGSTLATGSYDRSVVLWDLASGRLLRTLKEHNDAVHALAFSPDGKSLATASADRTVKVWEVATGRRVTTLSDATAELYAVAFSADGTTVFAGGVDRNIRAWRWSEPESPLAKSAFAHDAAVIRLATSADGRWLVSTGEDRAVKLWDPATLVARSALPAQPDWPQALALSRDGKTVAVGRHDGSLSTYVLATAKPLRDLRGAPSPAEKSKPELVRNASLNPPSPRGAPRGSRVRLTLSGNGVGRSTAVVFEEMGFKVAIVSSEKADPNRLEVDLTVASDARVGVHRFTATTPLGVPAPQSFAVDPHPLVASTEPDDDPVSVKAAPFPATFTGTIEKPGDVDHVRFAAKAGQTVVIRATTRSLGSTLLPQLSLTDERGQALAEVSSVETTTDPVLTARVTRDGLLTLRVGDVDLGGSGNHFYRISLDTSPYLAAVAPLGVERGRITEVNVLGANLGKLKAVPLSVPALTDPGSLVAVPVKLPDGGRPIETRRVVVADGPQTVEVEPNDEPSLAKPVGAPGGVSGTIVRDGDVDLYRFKARRGERVILEVYGQRLGTPIDPAVEVLDAGGNPVPRAVLRPLAETEVAFRDHNASGTGIRLTHWNELAVNDVVLIGRELSRIAALPRNPDDDCQFWGERGRRVGLLETTPEHHPMNQPVVKVDVHPPGTSFPPGGASPVVLYYRNDDGGPSLDKDSHLTFDPPADGFYLARVSDARGLGGASFGYHLVVRRPRPDFLVALSTENPSVPRGGTALVNAEVTRLDGFDGPVEISALNLPPGVTSTPAVVERGAFTAQLALSAETTAPTFSPPAWKLRAVSLPDDESVGSTSGAVVRHEIDPGGPHGGWVTVTPPPNLTLAVAPGRVVIRPGHEVTLKLAVTRGPAFAGRVPVEIKNLPPAVRVLNIGLNGVLITETQTQRTVTLFAEPWAGPLSRSFYAVGRAEAAGTDHSSPPLSLVVEPGGPAGHASTGSTSAGPRTAR